MRCILDLGLPKTGSKARQLIFLNDLRRIREQRAVFPESGRDGPWHRPLYEALAAGERASLDSVMAELAEQTPTPDVVILSYEELYLLDQTRIEWLRDAFHDLTAVIFLRRQDQIVNSFHNQLHKAHRISIEDIETYEANMLNHDIRYDHQATLMRWMSVLGRDALRPVIYDKQASSALAFFEAAGIALDMSGHVEQRPNRAIDGYGMSVLRWVKRLAPSKDDLPAIVTAAHRALAPHFVPVDDQGERYTLTLQQRQRIVDRYQRGNEWVRETFFPEKASLFIPLEHNAPEVPDYDQGREAAEAIIRAWRDSPKPS